MTDFYDFTIPGPPGCCGNSFKVATAAVFGASHWYHHRYLEPCRSSPRMVQAARAARAGECPRAGTAAVCLRDWRAMRAADGAEVCR